VILWPWQEYDDGAVEISAIEVISLLKPFGKVRSPRDAVKLILTPQRGRALLRPVGLKWRKTGPDCDKICSIAIGRAYDEYYGMGLTGNPLLGPVTMMMPSGIPHQIPFMVWVGDLRPVYLYGGKWTDVMPGKDAYFEP